MLSDKMQAAFDEQINKEFYSAHIYLAMSAYFESIDLPGAANWMVVQFQEEEFHAMKMFDYVHERDGQVTLKTIDAPPASYDSPLAAFEEDYRAIIAEIVSLRSGSETIIRTMDLYMPFYGLWQEQGIYDECWRCWEEVNESIHWRSPTSRRSSRR